MCNRRSGVCNVHTWSLLKHAYERCVISCVVGCNDFNLFWENEESCSFDGCKSETLRHIFKSHFFVFSIRFVHLKDFFLNNNMNSLLCYNFFCRNFLQLFHWIQNQCKHFASFDTHIDFYEKFFSTFVVYFSFSVQPNQVFEIVAAYCAVSMCGLAVYIVRERNIILCEQ